MITLLISALIVTLVAIGYVLIAGPKMLLIPKRRKPQYYQERFGLSDPSQIGLSHEERTLLTDDGWSLKYWIIENRNCTEKDSSIIFLHGITDSKVSGLNYARELREAYRRFFLIDMRRHGDSEGKYCTYGYYEKYDVIDLINKIKSEDPGTEITLLGVSMGAAIAIQAAAIDERVARVIAVAPFYDLFSIVLDQQVRRTGIRSKLLLRLVLKRAEKLAKFKVADVSPARDIRSVRVPVLIVHGEGDTTVKKEYSQRLAKLNERAQLLWVPEAGHVDVLERGGSDYLEKLSAFIKNT